MNYSSNEEAWRLVHDGKQVVTFNKFPFGSVTQSINTIEEFATEQEGLNMIESLGLTEIIEITEIILEEV